ncbi:hypothetical protein PMSM_11565 [Paenibacillus macquariensis subsp. macquariensis]|uniref:Uncharacterized protein n=1 Tax=Paenibacillus macquariensis TaxID=948756 RepID=A0ABY1JVN1_9BACL|nr:hypothetical protein PMSM_11565 [Paenibacillus macquariensis subsp. macquariensis]SIQ84617.1 hypothetical protein SAMN05421578_104319 [Paenibacillus macquariensis]
MIRLLRKEWAVAVLFLAPSLIGFSIFYLISFGMGFLYSFQDGWNQSCQLVCWKSYIRGKISGTTLFYFWRDHKVFLRITTRRPISKGRAVTNGFILRSFI